MSNQRPIIDCSESDSYMSKELLNVERQIKNFDLGEALTVDEARQQIAHVAKMMDPAKRQETARQMRDALERLKTTEEQRIATKKAQIAALEPVRDWICSEPSLVLEKNDCVRLHRLRDAALCGRVIRVVDASAMASDAAAAVFAGVPIQTFLVSHNWASAFEGAEGISDDFRLPADTCTFELRVSGRNLILLASDDPAGVGPRRSGLAIESGDYWVMMDGAGVGEDAHDQLLGFVWSHVRAICIALDADVAVTEVIRAPVKLNEKRARAGKSPLPDYRVVDLARRHRIANPAASTPGTGTKKRLHFRRGHWRHYENSKTWVKWCLVGNPDLGFINKHYRL